jgi:hypothetical protein
MSYGVIIVIVVNGGVGVKTKRQVDVADGVLVAWFDSNDQSVASRFW